MGEAVPREMIKRWCSSRKFDFLEPEGRTLPKLLSWDPFTKSMDPCALTRHIELVVTRDELKDNVQQLVQRGRRSMNFIIAIYVRAGHTTEQSDRLAILLRAVEPAFICLRDAGFENLGICMAEFDLDLAHLFGQLESDGRNALFVFFFPVHDTLLTNLRLVVIEDAKEKRQQRIEDARRKRNRRS